jgi:1-aminocyclopropane-1-carboxylate deaminase/D-cysteine desulfhydrase-like pyridoxal-dependent ACC family enzyme
MYENIHIENIVDPIYSHKEIEVGVLRLDKTHPIVSGNKVFKLQPYLKKAEELGISKLITFGGPFSNHLHATAYMARQKGIKATGLIRGTEPKKLSTTLEECREMGMELTFIDHETFERLDLQKLGSENPDSMVIPQGGYGRTGAEGAASIMSLPGVNAYNFIVAACGTGTMGAGLIAGAMPGQTILLVSVLKNNFSIRKEIEALLTENEKQHNFVIEDRYHLGGYAKKNQLLFDTMNRFYQQHGIPTDFVYTGKLIFATDQLISENHFPKNSKVLIVHSGGLQGNRSLAKNELSFDSKS